MRYAIISDLHSNLAAVLTVLEKIDELGVDKTLCLGDLVGYYCNPNEIIELMIKREIKCIMGNHDVVACGRIEPFYFNPTAASAILWTREHLTPENLEFIKYLRDWETEGSDLRMVHGSVADRDEYLLARPEIENSMNLLKADESGAKIAFFGHTHRRIYYEHDGSNLYQGRDNFLQMSPESYYLVNPGSVGQPRDGDPRASFCVYDSEELSIQFIHMEYDIDDTASKVEKLDFGQGLARRLYKGA